LVAVLVVAGVGAYCYLRNEVYTLVITQPELQARADAMFPIRKTYLLVAEIEYAHPRIELDEQGRRVRAALDATTLFTVNQRRLSGSATASGGLRYVPAEGAFYLDRVVVERVVLGGVPDEYADRLTVAATTLLQEHYRTHPVYVLRDDLKQRLAKAVLRDVRVQSGALVIDLGL
jgi:hypothetical protein